MIDLQAYLERKLRDVMSAWNEADIYAISFFVYANETYEYDGYSNIMQFSVSYNTEKDCDSAGELSEERWNYAFWRQNETPIIEANNENEGMKILFEWYEENGVYNIGYENYDACYDSEMRYIGRGPVGYYELLSEITAVAKKLQNSGFVKNKFGRPIPIIFLLVLASSAGCGGNPYSFKEPIDEIESIEIVSAENSLEFTVLKTLSGEEQEDFLERFQTREFHKYLGARRQSVP